MWCYRRMLRISWKNRARNEQVLLRMEKRPEIIKSIKVWKVQYLGHVMRGDRYRILKLVIEGKIQGSRSVGRRRTSWLRNLREQYKVSSIDRAVQECSIKSENRHDDQQTSLGEAASRRRRICIYSKSLRARTQWRVCSSERFYVGLSRTPSVH